MLARCVVLLGVVAATQTDPKMQGFIVGGSFASIVQYPHSACLTVHCMTPRNNKEIYTCGSSILNQRILLTAGHCLYLCGHGSRVTINLGDESRYKGVVQTSETFMVHEEFTEDTVQNDIALVLMKAPVKLNSKASRVALLRNPPYTEPASVAGWGLIDDIQNLKSHKLKSVDQTVWSHADCIKRITDIPLGTICASNKDATQYPSKGDSGSALVVRGYIQIGLVSFAIPDIAKEVIVYTDTGYFYNWIKLNAHRLYCFGLKKT